MRKPRLPQAIAAGDRHVGMRAHMQAHMQAHMRARTHAHRRVRASCVVLEASEHIPAVTLGCCRRLDCSRAGTAVRRAIAVALHVPPQADAPLAARERRAMEARRGPPRARLWSSASSASSRAVSGASSEASSSVSSSTSVVAWATVSAWVRARECARTCASLGYDLCALALPCASAPLGSHPTSEQPPARPSRRGAAGRGAAGRGASHSGASRSESSGAVAGAARSAEMHAATHAVTQAATCASGEVAAVTRTRPQAPAADMAEAAIRSIPSIPSTGTSVVSASVRPGSHPRQLAGYLAELRPLASSPRPESRRVRHAAATVHV